MKNISLQILSLFQVLFHQQHVQQFPQSLEVLVQEVKPLLQFYFVSEINENIQN